MHRWIHNSSLSLIATFALLAGAATVFAAEQVVSAKEPQSPLAAATDPNVVRKLDQLRKDAAEKSAIRIIVGLRVPFAPEGTLDSATAAQQREEIARMQSYVLEKVPSLKQRPENIKQFESIPFMTLEVNSKELEMLARLPEVTSLQEDKILAPAMGEAVPKNK